MRCSGDQVIEFPDRAFAQCVEVQVEKELMETCPDPTHKARYHPFLEKSRRRGSKCLEMGLVQRFLAKGGGFISTASDLSLQRLGVVPKHSKLANRTALEYCSRALLETNRFTKQYIESAPVKVLNFCMDAATVGGEHVARSSKSRVC